MLHSLYKSLTPTQTLCYPPSMEINLSDINAEFGVGGAVSVQTDSMVGASRPGPSIPQSLPAYNEDDYTSLGPRPMGTDDFIPGEYLPNIPQVLDREHNPINPWPPQLIIELALRIDPLEDILARNDMGQEQYDRFLEVPTFRREVAAMMKELSDNGQTFQRKARTQAEVHLETLDTIINNMEVAASTRLDGIKQLVKWGDLEPRDKKDDASTGTAIQVNINF